MPFLKQGQLKDYAYYKTGGTCDLLCAPESVEELAEHVKEIQKRQLPLQLLGGGTNSLVIDEHFAGAFPTWLSPEQVRILPISEKTNEYATEVLSYFKSQISNLRCTVDTSNDRIQAKIKVAAEEKIPYLLVVGPRDAESRSVSLRC